MKQVDSIKKIKDLLATIIAQKKKKKHLNLEFFFFKFI